MATKGHRSWGTIRKCSSGNLQASYIGPDHRRHYAPETYSVRSRAEGWLHQERKLIENSDWTPPASRIGKLAKSGVTLADYGQRWIDEKNIKERTRMHYNYLFDKHIKPQLGHVALRTPNGR